MDHQDPKESLNEYDPLRHGSSPLSSRLQMPPPCLFASHILCGCTDTRACICANIEHTNTYLHPHLQKSNTLGQLYLSSLSPWKCTKDQTKEGWNAYGFSTSLLPGQSNNIRPRWCSKVGPGPRSLPARSTAEELRSEEGRGAASKHMAS